MSALLLGAVAGRARPVVAAVGGGGGGEFATTSPQSSVTVGSITWTFDTTYQVGQYITGDYFVVDPGGGVTIDSVSPAWDGTKNGSMLEPAASDGDPYQGLDSRSFYFGSGLRQTFPVTIDASTGTKSLLSSKGLATPNSGGAEESLDEAAVLTVVATTPYADEFRPPYVAVSGGKPVWRTSDVNYNLLPALTGPGGEPDYYGGTGTYYTGPNLAKVLPHFGPTVWGCQMHPQKNCAPYPRDDCAEVSDLALLCLLDIANASDLANRLIQRGIDLYACSLTNDTGFTGEGGFGHGYKWPILFAGLMLGDAGMQAPAALSSAGGGTIRKFGEDGHTYYGVGSVARWGQDCAALGIDSPWYVNHDCQDPNGIVDCDPGLMVNAGSYRQCCSSASYVGEALAAAILAGGETAWDYAAFFDYVRRWVAEDIGGYDVGAFASTLVEDVWDLYAATYGMA